MIRFATLVYRSLLRIYPEGFRREHGDEMASAFAARCRAARERGAIALLGVLFSSLPDAVFNGIAERLGRSRSGFGMARRKAVGRKGRLSVVSDDVRGAARRLRRAPAFAASMVLTIGVGLGAFVSIWGVVDNVLLEPVPYERPEELVYLWRNYEWMNLPRGWMGGIEVVALRDGADAFTGVATVRSGRVNLSSRDGGEPQEIAVMLTSANFYDLLGVQPVLGRGLRPGEDEVGAAQVVILGHALWRQRYGGDPEVIGRRIELDGELTEVVGVMPPWFRFARHSSLGSPTTADAYVNLRWDLRGRAGGEMAAIARLRPGVSPELVQSQLDATIEPIDREIFGDRGLKLWAIGLHEDLIAEVRPALAAIVGAALFMVVILGVNLANLLLGRAARRGREMAVCAALGAGRGSLIRDCLAESLLLSLAGGLLGLAIAQQGTAAIAAAVPPTFPRREAIAVDWSVALAALLVALAVGVLAGLVPAFAAARTNIAGALRSAGRRVTGSMAPRALIVAQVAISLVLLAGAGVLARSFMFLLRADPGFDPRGVLTMRVPLSPDAYPDDADIVSYYTRLRDRLAALPGLEAAGATSALPLTRETSQTGASFPGAPGNTGDLQSDSLLVDSFIATPGYFDALGISVLAGRGFAESDTADSAPVAVIDDVVAGRFFPNADPLGHVLQFRGIERTVVGVIDQPRLYNVHSDDRGQVFVPHSQLAASGMSVAIRSPHEAAALTAMVRDVVHDIDADQPIAEVRTMEQIAADSLGGERLSLLLIGGFALGALLLATLGLYGVVSNTVTSRTQEVGVRMALGADAAQVRAMVVWQGMRLTLVGLAIGLAGAFAGVRLLAGLLVGVEPIDPPTLIAVSLVLAAVTLLASYIPARRAAAVDPMAAIAGRGESGMGLARGPRE